MSFLIKLRTVCVNGGGKFFCDVLVFSWNLFLDAYWEYLVNIASGYALLPDGTKP